MAQGGVQDKIKSLLTPQRGAPPVQPPDAPPVVPPAAQPILKPEANFRAVGDTIIAAIIGNPAGGKSLAGRLEDKLDIIKDAIQDIDINGNMVMFGPGGGGQPATGNLGKREATARGLNRTAPA